MSSPRLRRTIHVALVALAAAALGACASGEQPPRLVGEAPEYGTVRLALSADHAELASRVELRFEPADGGDAIVDDFGLDGDPSLLSRNYRVPPGDYTIIATGTDERGDTVLEGARPDTVIEPGDNVIDLFLTPTAEDLSDVYIGIDSPSVGIGHVAADGDAREGGLVRIQVEAKLTDGASAPARLGAEGRVLVEGPDGEVPLLQVELVPDPDNPMRFAGEAPADWLGPARVEVRLLQDGAVADSTTKSINVHPSPETQEMVRAVSEVLVQNEDGTFQRVREPIVTESGFVLQGEGLAQLNEALSRMNEAAFAGDYVLGLGNVPAALVFASLGYWACVAKVLKCELLTAGCIASAPAAALACAEVCAGTAGLGCAACIVAAVGGVVDICDSAYDCWVEARRQGCVP